MILLEIKVPSVDKSYDFQLDEDANIYNIIAEISELISQKEHCNIVGNFEDLRLCSSKNRQILSVNNTLRECNVQTGDSLILV
ncbi:MAG: EsaB/YukD family protein [Lachnospiraceae bacterium]|nr:EsaB/YukD family protein [Lachnospiraceae bacterium]